MKVEDVKAAFDYLERRPEVDSNRMAMLGVCMVPHRTLHN